jgi:hypothetical protein
MYEMASTTPEQQGGLVFEPLCDKARAVMDVHLPQSPRTGIDELVRHTRRDNRNLSRRRFEGVRTYRIGRAALLNDKHNRYVHTYFAGGVFVHSTTRRLGTLQISSASVWRLPGGVRRPRRTACRGDIRAADITWDGAVVGSVLLLA